MARKKAAPQAKAKEARPRKAEAKGASMPKAKKGDGGASGRAPAKARRGGDDAPEPTPAGGKSASEKAAAESESRTVTITETVSATLTVSSRTVAATDSVPCYLGILYAPLLTAPDWRRVLRVLKNRNPLPPSAVAEVLTAEDPGDPFAADQVARICFARTDFISSDDGGVTFRPVEPRVYPLLKSSSSPLTTAEIALKLLMPPAEVQAELDLLRGPDMKLARAD